MSSFVTTRSGKAVLAVMLSLWMVLGAFGATISTKREARNNRRIKEAPATERRMAASRHARPVQKGKVSAKAGKATAKAGKTSAKAAVEGKTKIAVAATGGAKLKRASLRTRHYERFTASSYLGDPAEGDVTAGEDPVVRAAAVNALGSLNGTVVAIDPANGRILAMVNQKLALSSGAQPCSTIKIPVALAALSEGIVTKDTPVQLGGGSLDMNAALAHSNNAYFEALGRRLGFQKVSYYAHLFGLGELAGWNLRGEHLGTYPAEAIPAEDGGVGKMCSYGEGINMTPLQLGALMASMANGGTLYYLQHPNSAAEAASYQPRVKRYLDIAPLIPEVSVGMLGATQYGTARRLRSSFTTEDVVGKTGTCSTAGTRFGWFGSYANSQYGRIVVVVFLKGNRSVFGPRAAELAGHFFHNLDEAHYFAGGAAPVSAAVVR